MTKRKYVPAEEGCGYPFSRMEAADGNGYWREFNTNGRNMRMSTRLLIFQKRCLAVWDRREGIMLFQKKKKKAVLGLP